MALDATYHYKPVVERYSSLSADDDELYDMPANVAVSLAFALAMLPRYRHNDAAVLASLQERLIMPATDRIIGEIRAMRDGSATAPSDKSALNPYNVTAVSLRDIRTELQQLRNEIVASRADSDEVESLLLQIIAALG